MDHLDRMLQRLEDAISNLGDQEDDNEHALACLKELRDEITSSLDERFEDGVASAVDAVDERTAEIASEIYGEIDGAVSVWWRWNALAPDCYRSWRHGEGIFQALAEALPVDAPVP